MHVITAGTTEVHIDVHQPVESKEESWPWMTVQKYAALGGMVGNQWEGDQQMLKDTPTMERRKSSSERWTLPSSTGGLTRCRWAPDLLSRRHAV